MPSLRQGLIVFAAVAVGLAIAVAATGGFSTGDVDRVVEIQLDDQSYVDSEAHLDTENCTLEATVTNRYEKPLYITVTVLTADQTRESDGDTLRVGETKAFTFGLDAAPVKVIFESPTDSELTYEQIVTTFPECVESTDDADDDNTNSNETGDDQESD